MQTDYNSMASAFSGMLADNGPKDVFSGVTAEAIGFGLGLVKFSGKDNGVRLPKVNDVDFVLSAALVASDAVTVTVNGNSTASITFATSHANTMALIEAAVEALDGVASATVSSNTLTIVPDEGVSLSVSGTIVNGGAGTATISVTHGTSDTALCAISIASHNVAQDSNGVAQYAAGEAVNAMKKGRCYVYVEEAVTPESTVYCRFRNGDDADQVPGQFRGSADSSRAFAVSAAKYVTSASADGFAVIEINLP